VVIGSILFLLCAFLLDITSKIALPLALIAVLTVQPFQYNLGTAISMGAMCAVLIALSLPLVSTRNAFTPNALNAFTPISLAVMAYTIRPQLGLIAIFAAAVALWHNRSKALATAGLALVGLLTIWLLIFIRDTGLLPLSRCPGTNPNPQLRELICNTQVSLHLSSIKAVLQQHWIVFGLTVLAITSCIRQSTRSTPSGARNDFRTLGIFSVAVVATVLMLIAAIGPYAPVYSRYYIPIVEGYLYVFLITNIVHLWRNGAVLNSSLLVAATAILLALLVMLSLKKLSLPSESARRICTQVLTAEERLQFEHISRGSGYTLLQMECPIGSFDDSSRIMMSDLFFSTHNEYFDTAWDQRNALAWLQKNGIGRIVYLNNDLRWGLTDLQKLDEYCKGSQIKTHDPRGPLVIIDVIKCNAQSGSN
jgi:hypothetical protein